MERRLAVNENLFRPQFDKLKLSDKLWLMQTLATRYHLTFVSVKAEDGLKRQRRYEILILEKS